MNTKFHAQQQATCTPMSSLTPVCNGLLQRKCACGQHTAGSGGECEECRKERQGPLQRAAVNKSSAYEVSLNVSARVRSPGQPCEAKTPTLMKSRFGQEFSQVQAQNPSSHVSATLGRSVGAELPQPVDDPLHQPIIEQYRREHGLPPGGIDEEGRQVGPSDAEIKYGGLSMASRTLSSVFYVSFQNVSPPSVPDHSQVNPGPDVTGANRAGYTRVRLQKRMSIVWDNGPVDSSGRIPLYIQSLNVFYRLDPIEIFVSSNYGQGSCPYQVTLTHEQSHVNAFLRIFQAGRDSLLQRLSGMAIPTQTNPMPINPTDIQTTQNSIGERMRQLIVLHSGELVAQMEADRANKDSPASYRAVYAQCTSSEW